MRTTFTFELAHLIQIEVTKYPRTKTRDIELIIAGEARKISPAELHGFLTRVEEMKKFLKV